MRSMNLTLINRQTDEKTHIHIDSNNVNLLFKGERTGNILNREST